MNKKYGMIVIMLIFLPTIFLTIADKNNYTPYGSVIGRVTDVEEFTVLMNQANGTYEYWHWCCLYGRYYWDLWRYVSFFSKWDNFTTPEGMPAAVDAVYGYQPYVIDTYPPTMLGFFFDNWSTSYDVGWSGDRYIGVINVSVWYEPYYTLTVQFDYGDDSWNESYYANQSVCDQFGIGSLYEADSSRPIPQANLRTYILIAWGIGWLGTVSTVIAIRRRRDE